MLKGDDKMDKKNILHIITKEMLINKEDILKYNIIEINPKQNKTTENINITNIDYNIKISRQGCNNNIYINTINISKLLNEKDFTKLILMYYSDNLYYINDYLFIIDTNSNRYVVIKNHKIYKNDICSIKNKKRKKIINPLYVPFKEANNLFQILSFIISTIKKIIKK